MEGSLKDQRVPVMMDSDFVRRIDVYRHREMIATRAQAIRALIHSGLEKEIPAQAEE